MSDLYIRHNLAATRNGAPDPVVEVECWLDALEDLLRDVDLDVAADTATSQQAFELLAVWAKLQRVRPELIRQCGGVGELDWAQARLNAQGQILAGRAFTALNPIAWFGDAHRLETSVEQLIDPATEIEQAVALLEDLDDSELVLAAARRFGVSDPQIEADVQRCVDWLYQNADLFLPASAYVQAIGMAMRPDLEEQDYELAATALKLLVLLDAASQAEAELTTPQVEPLPAAVVKGLYEKYLQEQAAKRAAILAALALTWLPPLRRRPVGRAEPSAPAEGRVWEWLSPGGDLTARLIIPDPPPRGDDEPLTLAMFDASHREALTLAGHSITLAGVHQTLDETGRTEFILRELRASGQPPRLYVGAARIEWDLQVEPSRE